MDLNGMKVAVLATDGFEQVELTEPVKALRKVGATVYVVAPDGGQIRGWDHTDWGDSVDVDVPLQDASPEEYDALMLPGGVLNPDKLRMNESALEFTRHFFSANKPVAAICHGPQILIDAGVVSGRRLTSYPAIRVDLRNAGANWIDQEVVVDSNLITSRKPDDIPAFNQAMIEVLSRIPAATSDA